MSAVLWIALSFSDDNFAHSTLVPEGGASGFCDNLTESSSRECKVEKAKGEKGSVAAEQSPVDSF